MISVIYLKFVIVFYLAILLFFVIREGVKEQRKFPERAQNMQKLSPIFLLLNALRDRSRSCLCGPRSRYYSPWHKSISKYDVLSPEYHRTFGEPSFGPCTLKAAPMTRRDPAAAPWGSGCPLCILTFRSSDGPAGGPLPGAPA